MSDRQSFRAEENIYATRTNELTADCDASFDTLAGVSRGIKALVIRTLQEKASNPGVIPHDQPIWISGSLGRAVCQYFKPNPESACRCQLLHYVSEGDGDLIRACVNPLGLLRPNETASIISLDGKHLVCQAQLTRQEAEFKFWFINERRVETGTLTAESSTIETPARVTIPLDQPRPASSVYPEPTPSLVQTLLPLLEKLEKRRRGVRTIVTVDDFAVVPLDNDELSQAFTQINISAWAPI